MSQAGQELKVKDGEGLVRELHREFEDPLGQNTAANQGKRVVRKSDSAETDQLFTSRSLSFFVPSFFYGYPESVPR